MTSAVRLFLHCMTLVSHFILSRLCKTVHADCHKQAIRVLGLLGALDPYKHKVNIGMIDQSRDASAVSLSESKSSQDSGKPGIPYYQSQFGDYLFKTFYGLKRPCILIHVLLIQFLHFIGAVFSGALLHHLLLVLIYSWIIICLENWKCCVLWLLLFLLL